MSDKILIGEGSENILEVLANISNQVLEMNGRMGGMEETIVRVETENRWKDIQPEYNEIRRAMVHSTTLSPGQAHNLCSPSQSRTGTTNAPLSKLTTLKNHLGKPTPHPNPQPYQLPKENLLFLASQLQYQTPFQNNSNSSFHEPYASHPTNAPNIPYQDYQYENPLYDEIHDELNNDEFWYHEGDMMGYRGDKMGYRGDRIGNRGNRSRERNDQYRGLNTIKVTLPRFKGSGDPEDFLEWKIQSDQIFLTNSISKTLKVKYALMQFKGYLTPNYYQEVFKKVYMLRQEKNMECTVIRFMANLRYDMLNPLKLKHYKTLETTFNDASKVEADKK
ncbi:hypothetical protein KY289_030353 [Solanum tuberosum]|nr:hypothetical protein KY289_030353 [Solanum tuberosum]